LLTESLGRVTSECVISDVMLVSFSMMFSLRNGAAPTMGAAVLLCLQGDAQGSLQGREK
jgi:hypothetical protein